MKAFAGLGIAATAALVAYRTYHAAKNRQPAGELLALIDELPHHAGLERRLAAIERAFFKTFHMPLAIVLGRGDALSVQHQTPGFVLNHQDLADADEAIRSGAVVRQRRGHGDRVSFPLLSASGCLGTFLFSTDDRRGRLNWPLIRSFANQSALALLRSDLEEQARHARALAAADRLQKALLDSIAHNLKTPLASIIGSLSALQEDGDALDSTARHELLSASREQAERLNLLISNLLDLNRLESGTVEVRRNLCDVQDVIGAALEQLEPAKRGRVVEVAIEAALPPVPMEFVWIVQVMVNLLDNAFKYSPQDSTIVIDARLQERCVAIAISDGGDGIAQKYVEVVFEKFNRGGRSGESEGLGLGLSICRGLVEAHHGTIWMERLQPRGTKAVFTLPLDRHNEERAVA